MSFSELFGPKFDSEEMEEPDYTNTSRVTASGFTNTIMRVNDNNDVNEMKRQIEEMRSALGMKIMNDQAMKDDLDADNENAMRGRRTSNEKASRIRSDSVISGYSTIMPNDSASRVRPLNYNPKTQISAQMPKKDFSPMIPQSSVGSMFDTVIAGYKQSPEEKIEELDCYTQINEISGLPIIFVNVRLNFLAHIHEPLQRFLTKANKYPCYESMQLLNDFIRKNEKKDKAPHEQLLYTVIRSTISMSRNKVIANPFNLPVLEPNMRLNDKLIYMCFDQLYIEYQTEWFKTLKDVNVPAFHDSYKNIQRAPVQRKTQTTSHSRRKQGSVISFLTS